MGNIQETRVIALGGKGKLGGEGTGERKTFSFLTWNIYSIIHDVHLLLI